MAGDRISESYLGKISNIMQVNSKKRIDWIISQVEGKDVLDIGCSQGITDLLLARQGFSVLAIDNDKDSISYANEMIKDEDKDVQKNINFVETDFLLHEFKYKKYDTIILGEVLEHLFNPLLFIEKVSHLLKAQGKVIVTVPFGINAHFDHKRTYYFVELYDSLNRFLKVENVHFLSTCIAMTCRSKENKSIVELPINLDTFTKVENAFFSLNEAREQTITSLKEQLNDRKIIEENNKYLTKQNKELVAVIDVKNDEINRKTELVEEQIRKIETCIKLYEENNIMLEEIKLSKTRLLAKSKKIEKEYIALCNSKLGKIQRQLWKIRSKVSFKQRLKNWAKKYKIFRSLAKKYRKINKNSNSAEPNVVIPIVTELANLPAGVRRERFIEASDRTFMNRISDYLNKIPYSNGGRYYEKSEVRIGVIADEFLFNSLKDSADFTALTPINWREELSKQEVLMVVSAWRGLDEEWRGVANPKSNQRKMVLEIIAEAKKLNIKTVFYSKEDPPNYEHFLGLAKECEYIFTTCQEVVNNYNKDCNNEKVSVLSFGINPLYHNPVGSQNEFKQSGVIFSGSWMKKYPDRMKDMNMLLRGIMDSTHKLKIIDRNYSRSESENYIFPVEYWKYISPEVDHATLQKIHKLYNWALNVNTVTKSMTMFANRAYELQAAGNLLISNYSMGVNSKLPFVFTANSSEEVTRILDSYKPEDLYERQMAGVRSVMTGETAYDRINFLLKTIGFEQKITNRSVLVVASKLTDKVKAEFDAQTYNNKAICTIEDFTEENKANYDIIAFFDAECFYDTFYLEDMINAFKYTDVDYVTKDAYYCNSDLIIGKEHDYVDIIQNKSATVFWGEKFSAIELLILEDGITLKNGYSIDHFNYNKGCKEVEEKIKNPSLSVIVPIYNNGKHLFGKCFSSLYRSSMFEEMEIILVDDGSTDLVTRKVVKFLERNYPNVISYMFEVGGSGSASRPRNKGCELANAEYITFLDPDNEAINDGYSKLYRLIIEKSADLVIGNMLKLTSIVADMKYIETIKNCYGAEEVLDDSVEFLKKINFMPMSIQAMVIRKHLIINNMLKQVEGAVGQDTLFSWELVYTANRIATINVPIHIYYAATEGSTVNAVGRKYFDRFILIEEPRKAFLERSALISTYMNTRFTYYYTEWIMKQLSKVSMEDEEYCSKIVYSIFNIYKEIYVDNSKYINQFINACDAGDYSQAMMIVRNHNK